MSSEQTTESDLRSEAAGKKRKELQSYLKSQNLPATGTNDVLQKRYLDARRVECGLATAAEVNLPTKPAKKKPAKKKELSETEKSLKKDAKRGWQYSEAKAALKAAILEGDVPLRPPPDEDEDDLIVYFNCRPEVQNFGGFDLFKGRLNDLRDQIRNNLTRAEEDEEAFMVFVKNHPKATVAAKGNYPEWEGHEAQRLLRLDMAAGYHETMEPKELWETEAEYTLFPLKVFREHIYQETRTQKYLNYLQKSDKTGEKWKDYRKPKDLIASSSSDEEDNKQPNEVLLRIEINWLCWIGVPRLVSTLA